MLFNIGLGWFVPAMTLRFGIQGARKTITARGIKKGYKSPTYNGELLYHPCLSRASLTYKLPKRFHPGLKERIHLQHSTLRIDPFVIHAQHFKQELDEAVVEMMPVVYLDLTWEWAVVWDGSIWVCYTHQVVFQLAPKTKKGQLSQLPSKIKTSMPWYHCGDITMKIYKINCFVKKYI